MVLCQQSHAQRGEVLSVNVSTDQESDRLLSLRASSFVPLPREIALCDPRDARDYFRWLAVYEAFGVSDHPLIALLGKRRLDAAMASAVSRAEHLDRVSHYASWLGRDAVRIVDLDRPTRDDPGSRATVGSPASTPETTPYPDETPRERSDRRRRATGRAGAPGESRRPPAVFRVPDAIERN